MNKKSLYNLLGKYLDNTCTPDERKLIDHWLGLLQEDAAFASYTADDLDSMHKRIWQKIKAETYGNTKTGITESNTSVLKKLGRWGIAACVIGVIGIFAYRLLPNKVPQKQNSFISIIPKTGIITKANTTAAPLKILLEDSSMVTLEPGAVLHYPTTFLQDKREAYLEGKALFEIAKNARRPFFIYHNNLVTHVLGTSFIINTKKQVNEAEVLVLTGRVEVSENKTLTESRDGKKENGVILTPNQKVVYTTDSRVFIPSLADNPLPLKKRLPVSFNFDDVELAKVLSDISAVYAVEIVTENETISKCTFTGNIAKQDLYAKLDIICRATNASYEVKGTKVLIKGAGCE